MSVTQYLSNLTQYQQLCTALLLVFAGCGAGYTASEADIMQPEEVNTFDVFSYKALEVNEMMGKTLANPTEDRLRTANNHLALGLQNWADRNEGENKELFNDYLDACRLVIDEKQAGHNIDDEKESMDELYNKLRSE